MRARTVPAVARAAALLLVVLVTAGVTLFSPYAAKPAYAECPTNPADCLGGRSVVDCLDPPTPAMPDTGATRFFLSAPTAPLNGAYNRSLTYYEYGYAGLQYHTYDLGCGPDGAVAPDALVNTSIANMMLGVATFLVGLTNSVREYAYDPQSMWGWTDDLIARASDALYERVFTVLGVVAVVAVGVWLLWSARRGEMSDAASVAGWAVLVMVVTTAVAAWPLQASRAADSVLTASLGAVNAALHPSQEETCGTSRCVDEVTPQRRASAVMTDVVLYQQWLSGELGSSDSSTANRYGRQLYASSAFTWDEAAEARRSPERRDQMLKEKQDNWKATAAKIKSEDPDAYEYLTGKQGTARIGSAFTALVAALVVVPFDLMASLLILLAFLIIRLAVAFLPAIAVFGILRPTSGPLRGLFRTVVAAILNCVIFGVGASVYLLAVELITGTTSLAGWQQILLIWLTGLVLWLLLRPFRRLTSLTGKNPFGELAGGIGSMHRKFLGDVKQLGIAGAGAYLGDVHALEANDEKRAAAARRAEGRPETWSRDRTGYLDTDLPPSRATGTTPPPEPRVGGDDADNPDGADPPERHGDRRHVPRQTVATRHSGGSPENSSAPIHAGAAPTVRSTDPVPVETGDSYVIYRPDRGYQTVATDRDRHAAARTSQAAANVAQAASAVRDLAAAAGATSRRDDRAGS